MSETSSTRGASSAGHQAVGYCPYCAEENLFPIADGGWECRSCRRAFAVRFLGLLRPSAALEQS